MNFLSETAEEFQVGKDLRVQPKMAAVHWALPQKGERLLRPTWGRGLQGLTLLSPDPCNTPTAGGSWAPERLLPRRHIKPGPYTQQAQSQAPGNMRIQLVFSQTVGGP